MTVQNLIAAIDAKKAELDRLRLRAPGGTANFDHSQDLELTYTSNAIEGNTLTAIETTMVIEQGITVAGKPLKDHLEVIDHFAAIRYVRDLARQNLRLTELDVRNLHRLVMLRSNPDIAGRYADQGRYVLTDTGRHSFPMPAEVPARMSEFAGWLGASANTPATAFTAHWRLVEIHPFNDGNGRTARLLMALVLIRGGYPPVTVRPQDRPTYIAALQQAQAGQGTETFDRFLYERLDAILGEYLAAARQALPQPTQSGPS
jgi:Fic family protein